METKDITRYGERGPLAEYVQRALEHSSEHTSEHTHDLESIRSAEYEGHTITIRTSYSVLVDRKPLKAYMEVDNDGYVYSHALPNYIFSSAVEAVKKMIDLLSDQPSK